MSVRHTQSDECTWHTELWVYVTHRVVSVRHTQWWVYITYSLMSVHQIQTDECTSHTELWVSVTYRVMSVRQIQSDECTSHTVISVRLRRGVEESTCLSQLQYWVPLSKEEPFPSQKNNRYPLKRRARRATNSMHEDELDRGRRTPAHPHTQSVAITIIHGIT